MYVNLAWAQLEEEAQYKLFLSLQSELLSFSFFMRRLSARSIISQSNMPDLEKKNFVKSGVISFIDIITPFTKTFLKGGHWILRCWLHAIPVVKILESVYRLLMTFFFFSFLQIYLESCWHHKNWGQKKGQSTYRRKKVYKSGLLFF